MIRLLLISFALASCAPEPRGYPALYARAAVDARVREFKLRSHLQSASCTVSHSSVTECSGVTEEGRACRFICRVDDCEWDGL